MAYRFEPFPDQGEIPFLRRRDIGGTVRAAFVFFRRNLKSLLVALFGIAGPVAVAFSIATASLMSRIPLFQEMVDPLGGPVDVESFEAVAWEAIWPSLVVLLLGMFVLTYLGPLVAFGFIRLYREGTGTDVEVTTSRVWEALRPEIWPVFSVALLFFGLVFLLFLLNVIPVLGTIAFLGMLIYIYPIVSVTYVTRVFESDSALSAFERARELVRGQWRYAAGVVLLVTLIGMVFVIACMVPASIWDAIVQGVYGESWSGLRLVSVAVGQVLQLLGSLIASLFTTIGTCFLFGSLKEEKEGSSIAAELEIFEPRDDRDGRPEERPVNPSSSKASSTPEVQDEDATTESEGRGFRGGGFSDS